MPLSIIPPVLHVTLWFVSKPLDKNGGSYIVFCMFNPLAASKHWEAKKTALGDERFITSGITFLFKYSVFMWKSNVDPIYYTTKEMMVAEVANVATILWFLNAHNEQYKKGNKALIGKRVMERVAAKSMPVKMYWNI